ncbi:hypothetical protein [Cellulomonas sp.]|uniref:hypothetical protein n=1 Tax=Cellulomonas sp. TaxID=40001 RepID=UPI0028127B86|nr:hypothetical protein [Cellulomonas sp.]
MAFIPPGQRCTDLGDLVRLLRRWVAETSEATVSAGTSTHPAYVTALLGGAECVLAGDTTRTGVQAFLDRMDHRTTLWVVPSRTERMCRVAVGDDAQPLDGFFLYTEQPFWAPRLLDAPDVVAVRLLEAVAVLHRRGHQHVRVSPGMSPSGVYWRLTLSAAPGSVGEDAGRRELSWSTGNGTDVVGLDVTASTTPDTVADALVAAVPAFGRSWRDWTYAGWYAELLALVERERRLPVSFADWFDDSQGWEVGWGTGVRFPAPPV